jgi:hypothetical protein
MSRIDEYERGLRDGVRWAVTWLHRNADAMNDPLARQILHRDASNMSMEHAKLWKARQANTPPPPAGAGETKGET